MSDDNRRMSDVNQNAANSLPNADEGDGSNAGAGASSSADVPNNDAGAPNTDGAGGSDLMKKDEKAGGEHLNLKVKAQDGNEIYFRVKKTTQFKKVFAAFCKKVGADLDSVRFLFDGSRINPTTTPAELEMEDDDVIDAMIQQTGGYAR